VLDSLFEMARVGVDGVNIHSYPGATYELFTFQRAHGRWRAAVEPEYYGMLMFAQAAPPGARLLGVSWRQRAGERLHVWATRAPDGRIRVVLINDRGRSQTVAVRAPATAGAATLERLTAPSLGATAGVTLAGQGFGSETPTGQLAGRPAVGSITPVAGSYSFRLPGASAALLTITRRAASPPSMGSSASRRWPRATAICTFRRWPSPLDRLAVHLVTRFRSASRNSGHRV
jgi:hypothetical protein